ncbi:molybdenum cofactor biosynthesis protein MoaE [Pannonibacter tanglangensis]|uniref:molybdenum cofactor biosynthesis protein MoaE n=1 Tax=Pannonibacter tanglangensis TaxID=2750084 RepID=UPI00329975C1
MSAPVSQQASGDRPLLSVRVQAEDFDPAEAGALLTRGRRDVGALVTFTGLCRDEQGRLAALELEHFPGMAEEQLTRIAEEALARWPLTGLVVIHRHGRIAPGANIVLVAAASSHRQAAFEAADFLMDYLKSRAPFWKKEILADGSAGSWVAARQTDEDRLTRW